MDKREAWEKRYDHHAGHYIVTNEGEIVCDAPEYRIDQIIADHNAAEALAVAREALREIEGMAAPLGYDAGHSGIHDLARAALQAMKEQG